MKKRRLTIIIVSLLVLVGTFLFLNLRKTSDETLAPEAQIYNEEEVGNIIEEKNIEIYAEEDDQNALDLLKKHTEVDYKESSLGAYVNGINGLNGNDNNYWSFYINDEYSLTGVDTTVLQKDDKMTWKYEAIETGSDTMEE